MADLEVPRIYFDGEARPNRPDRSGRLRAALVIVLGGKAQTYEWPIGRGDSHLAEWRAMLLAARVAAAMGFDRVELIGDNLGVIEQADGLTRRKPSDPEIVDLMSELEEIRTRCDIQIRQVGRDINLAGRLLEGGDTGSFRQGVNLLEDAEVTPWIEDAAAMVATQASPRTCETDQVVAPKGFGI